MFLLRTVVLLIPFSSSLLFVFLHGLVIFVGLLLFKTNEADNAGGYVLLTKSHSPRSLTCEWEAWPGTRRHGRLPLFPPFRGYGQGKAEKLVPLRSFLRMSSLHLESQALPQNKLLSISRVTAWLQPGADKLCSHSADSPFISHLHFWHASHPSSRAARSTVWRKHFYLCYQCSSRMCSELGLPPQQLPISTIPSAFRIQKFSTSLISEECIPLFFRSFH